MLTTSRPFVRRTYDEHSPLFSNFDPIVRRILLSRGVRDESELDLSLHSLLHCDDLKDIDKACEILFQALCGQSRIVVVGDYDVDGATSTTLAIRALREFGFKNVDFFIPDRVVLGYGLSERIVSIIHEEKKAELIITVDNGITSFDGVQRARELGIRVLVTDHHLSLARLPPADAIVNPNQQNCRFRSKNLAGVGVIFYVMLAFRAYLRNRGWFTEHNLPVPNMSRFMDLVAVGSIADVVTLDHNNRILIKNGIEKIRTGRCCKCFISILQKCRRNIAKIDENDICFSISPILNAAGRIDNMSLGVNCLLSDDSEEVESLVNELINVNNTRKEIEAQMHSEATRDLDQNYDLQNNNSIVIFDKSYHQGVVGLVATRIKEIYYKPTVAFAVANEDGTELKGSARSVDNLHIKDLLEKINSRHPDLLLRFGGHAMAAGMTIRRADLARFTDVFEKTVTENIKQGDLSNVWYSDGELPSRYLVPEFAEYLLSLGPWGNNYAHPTFDGIFTVKHLKLMNRHLKLTVVYPNSHFEYTAMIFNATRETRNEDFWHRRVRLGYKIEVSEWRGNKYLQLIVENYQILE